MIEQVEEAGPHSEVCALPPRNDERFFDVEVRVEVTRPAELVAALVAEGVGWVSKISSAVARTVRLRRRTTAIDILVSRYVCQHRGSSFRSPAAKQTLLEKAVVIATEYRVREARVLEDGTRECPALHQRVRSPRCEMTE